MSMNDSTLPAPYADASTNFIYNLLFCDELSLFAPAAGEAPAPWLQTLQAPASGEAAVRALAEEEDGESRVRVLAYNWLRQHEHSVPPRKLLGVIVEVQLERGLDTLAAYLDGRARYINQGGKLAVFEAAPAVVTAKISELFAAAQVAVDRIGPWDKARLAPPEQGSIRLTFLVSDGLYFGQGPFAVLSRDAMAGPIIQQAGELLQMVVGLVVK